MSDSGFLKPNRVLPWKSSTWTYLLILYWRNFWMLLSIVILWCWECDFGVGKVSVSIPSLCGFRLGILVSEIMLTESEVIFDLYSAITSCAFLRFSSGSQVASSS